MYTGRILCYIKFFPLCAMEGDRLSGGIAKLIMKLALERCELSGCPHWPLYCWIKTFDFIKLEAEWALEMV